jgi:nucleotidyltransferase substrate binding protein (TIGR01987 family)
MTSNNRWRQRFSNFSKALAKLTQAVEYIEQQAKEERQKPLDDSELDYVLDEIIKEGLIQRFEYTHELSWNVMKDYAFYQGNSSIQGSRDATREALQYQIITDGKIWMDMISSRNKTSHTYNEATADEIYFKIIDSYYPAFLAFHKAMTKKLYEDDNDN